jgi:hypothetical protein
MKEMSFKDQVEGWDYDMEFFPRKWGPFRVCFYEIQPNDGTKYQIMVGWDIGKTGFPNAIPYYSEQKMHLVIYNTGWYLFNDSEFDRVHEGNIQYVAEKLRCSTHAAKVIITFMKNIRAMHAKMLLSDREKNRPLAEDAALKR